jgi:DNA polymerase-3 subunit delta'
VGKTTLALAFAQALNCQAADGPCGQCRICRLTAQGRHPDVGMVQAADGTIKIDQIRELQRQAVLAPVEVRWRIFVIPNVERATREAANSLLKTLEEPPPHVVLMLTTLDAEALLPTVVSRCRVIPLRPLPVPQIRRALEERWGVEPSRADLLARLCGGRIGWAISALKDSAILERRQAALEALQATLEADPLGRLEWAARLSKSRSSLEETLSLWLSWWRDLLLLRAGQPDDLLTNVDQREMLEALAQTYQTQQITEVIHAIQRALRRIDGNVNPRLTLEALLLSLPRPAGVARG